MSKNKKIAGLSQAQFAILAGMFGFFICMVMAFFIYIIYYLSIPVAVSSLPPAPDVSAQSTKSIDPSPVPATKAPKATSTVLPTKTAVPTRTRIPTSTYAIIPTDAPTALPVMGTFINPVSIGVGYRFPGFGTLTVIKSSWKPGQTGFAIVNLLFQCERPPEQECNTKDFMLDALGKSGNGYEQKFDSAIPDPTFGSLFNPPIYGGGTEKGNVGFLIKNSEISLIMRVRLFLENDEYFFRISN